LEYTKKQRSRCIKTERAQRSRPTRTLLMLVMGPSRPRLRQSLDGSNMAPVMNMKLIITSVASQNLLGCQSLSVPLKK